MKENSLIHLRGMEFYAYHGVLEEERKLGQRFLIDLDIVLPAKTYHQDDLADTVNYAEVYAVVQECVEQKKYRLIETLAEAIAGSVIQGFNCSKVRVEVHKPNAPIPGFVKDISVEITREKGER